MTWVPDPPGEWPLVDSQGLTELPSLPTLTETPRKEVARFEAIDGTPLIRITDKRCVPFGFRSAREGERNAQVQVQT